MTPTKFFGLLYNIPTVQSLRILETATAFALLFAPESAKGFLEELGLETQLSTANIPTAHGIKGLREILTK